MPSEENPPTTAPEVFYPYARTKPWRNLFKEKHTAQIQPKNKKLGNL